MNALTCRWMGLLSPVVTLAILITAGCVAGDDTDRTMTIDHASVHRPQDGGSLRQTLDLPPGVVVIQTSPDNDAPVQLYQRAVATGRAVRVATDRALAITVGPELDSPDEVAAPTTVERDGDHLSVTIHHTQARLGDWSALRNVRWRPIVTIPLSELALGPGEYVLHIAWQPVKSLDDRTPHEREPVEQRVRFELTR